MNIINQREDLHKCYEYEIITAPMLKIALSSPVFVIAGKHDKMTDQENEWISKNVMHTEDTSKGLFPRIVPFPCFRLWVKEHQCTFQWWFSMQEEKAFCLMRDDGRLPSDDKMDKPIHAGITMNRWDTHARFRLHYDYKKVERDEYKSTADALDATLSYVSTKLIYFLFDVMSATSTVLKVTDDQPGRSVQWRLNREHYLVLNHHQAQTMQKHKRGVSDKDLVRGAHWRRAHLRRLNSDQFKHKKGMLVPVRKAWVGPIEWKGHDGKIYKVTEIKLDNSQK